MTEVTITILFTGLIAWGPPPGEQLCEATPPSAVHALVLDENNHNFRMHSRCNSAGLCDTSTGVDLPAGLLSFAVTDAGQVMAPTPALTLVTGTTSGFCDGLLPLGNYSEMVGNPSGVRARALIKFGELHTSWSCVPYMLDGVTRNPRELVSWTFKIEVEHPETAKFFFGGKKVEGDAANNLYRAKVSHSVSKDYFDTYISGQSKLSHFSLFYNLSSQNGGSAVPELTNGCVFGQSCAQCRSSELAILAAGVVRCPAARFDSRAN